MRLDASFKLMEERPDAELTFQRAKRGFRLRELNVLGPAFLGTLAHEIRAQQIGALACVAPGASVFDQPPVEPQLPVLLAHRHVVEIGDAGVRGLQSPEHALDLRAVF
jgi:hypothetical protein